MAPYNPHHHEPVHDGRHGHDDHTALWPDATHELRADDADGKTDERFRQSANTDDVLSNQVLQQPAERAGQHAGHRSPAQAE